MNKSITSRITKLIKSPHYRAMNKSEFARELSIGPKDRADLRQSLAYLVDKGELEIGKKSRYYLPRTSKGKIKTYQGRIEFSTKGKRRFAFFEPDDPASIPELRRTGSESLYIANRNSGTAMHGDRVAVEVVKKVSRGHSNRRKKRGDDDSYQGRVIEVLEREVTTIIGIYSRKGHSAVIVPDDDRLPHSFHLKEILREAKNGDVVVAEFLSWANRDRPPAARMIEVLGKPDAPGVDMLTVIYRYRLPLEFPPDVLAEAEAVEENIPAHVLERREDWRERQVFTIDPEDARDFDDAISVVELPDGKGWELAVHIADVSHYVKPGSALDREAFRRGNSVYLADRVIPMLPEKLSNGVCSLNPHVDRLTHAAVITFDKDGEMKKTRFVSAVINSCRRYTYEEAFTRLKLSEKAAREFDDPDERELTAHIRRAWRLASILRQRRFKKGCFDMDFPEVRVVLDDLGIAFGVKKTENDESHQLIEECMLAANEAVAIETKNAGAPSIYRIHEDPDPAKLDEFADLARSFGHKIGDPNIRAEIQKLTKAIRGRPEEHSLKLALLKSMMRASYSKEPIGHFGLAKANYCHFTSPIRRYADLVVHRALKKVMSRKKEPTAPEHPDKTPTEARAAEIADYISRTERVAADAERDSQQLKLIEYLEKLIEEDPERTFEATVTEIRPIGIFVELDEFMIKGLIRKMDLPRRDDYYYDRSRNRFLSGSSRKKSIGLVDKVKVKLVRIDKSRGFLDFGLVS